MVANKNQIKQNIRDGDTTTSNFIQHLKLHKERLVKALLLKRPSIR